MKRNPIIPLASTCIHSCVYTCTHLYRHVYTYTGVYLLLYNLKNLKHFEYSVVIVFCEVGGVSAIQPQSSLVHECQCLL